MTMGHDLTPQAQTSIGHQMEILCHYYNKTSVFPRNRFLHRSCYKLLLSQQAVLRHCKTNTGEENIIKINR